MLSWSESDQPPRDLQDLWVRISRLVRSMKDLAFRDGVMVSAAAAGDLVAHGQRSAPRRVIPVLNSATSGTPTVKVGEINATHVRLFASTVAVVDLVFVL